MPQYLDNPSILVTGFEPFGGDHLNPSWEACLRLKGEKIEGYTLQVEQLPCVFNQSLSQLETYILTYSPKIVLCVGLASARLDITVERIGINIDDARIPDNHQQQPIDQVIIKNGPAAYFATVPIKAMVQAIQQIGIPASVSQTAGTFVCNHVLYGALHLVHQKNLAIRTGFIHVPEVNNMPTETVSEALRAAIHACIQNDDDLNLIGGAIF